jgi:hypothetical protein
VRVSVEADDAQLWETFQSSFGVAAKTNGRVNQNCIVCESWGQQCEHTVTHDRLVMRRDSHDSYVHRPAKATAIPTSNPVAMPADAAIAA